MSTVKSSTLASSVRDFFTTESSFDLPVPVNPKDELYSLCDDPMAEPMKLINEDHRFEDNQKLRGCFIENSGFLVVGVIGLRGVGKSSVANLLANRLVEGPPFEGPFAVQTLDSLIEGYPTTTAGVDIYITQDRVILLDTQPLLDWSLTDLQIQYDLRTQKRQHHRRKEGKQEVVEVTGGSSTSRKWSIDGFAEITSLQLIAFLMSVCHVVVCVQDNLSNPSFLRLIDRAFGCKPLILVDDIVTPSLSGLPFSKGNRRPPFPVPVTETAESGAVESKPAKEVVTATTEIEADVEEVEEEEEEGAVACGNEEPGSDETGLGQAPAAAIKVCTPPDAAVAVAAAERTRVGSVEEVAEQAEVWNFVNQLLRLTDYTACLVHVYNCATVEAFVNPCIADHRLSAYRRLLTQAFPLHLQLASLVAMGPRILQRHIVSRQRRFRKQKQQSATNAATAAKVDRDGEVQLVSACDIIEVQNARTIPTIKGEASMEATEADIVSECCEELELLGKGLRKSRRSIGKVRTTPHTSTAEPVGRGAVSKHSTQEVFDGEDRVAALKDLARRIMEGRKAQLEPSASIASPRLFLLPATNEKGDVAFGSPTYGQCAHLLQEAILSTPRRHPTLCRSNMTELLWFDFAKQTWNDLTTATSSSHLTDYHSLLISNTL